jgi:hypothetical protein
MGGNMPEYKTDSQADHTDKEADHIKTYEIFRDYIKHEDNLVNFRTTWNITVQSFLIATFGFTFQKMQEVIERYTASQRHEDIAKAGTLLHESIVQFCLVMILLSAIGFVISVSTLTSVRAAKIAQRNISTDVWPKVLVELNKRNSIVKSFPLLLGGGSQKADETGHAPGVILPWLFMGFWLVVLFAVMFVLFSPDYASTFASLVNRVACFFDPSRLGQSCQQP